ncbi:MAG TPA: pirin family protein [Acidimicrobiia bacterium]|nr:pirin family protein [Acidimicrobiia bacterium]
MPAITVDNVLSLPRLEHPAPGSQPRPVQQVLTALTTFEGEGFQVRRAFPSPSLRGADPFILLDHLGAVEYAPGEAKGAPDHPHRGFETVTYIIDGAIEHRDSTGGGGTITDGATQWMTAGAGIVHSEMPPEYLVRAGGLFHGVQLWVNLPRAEKWAPPRYQDLESTELSLATTDDGGALVRVIAGHLGALAGPGSTYTPIVYAHATLQPGAELSIPWPHDFTAMAYSLAGHGRAGPSGKDAVITEGRLAVFGSGDHVVLRAGDRQATATPTLELLLLGGRPIHEPVVQYGPFVMNSRDEIVQAIEDYQAGRMGVIPPRSAF